MNLVSRTITGIVLIVIGIILIVIGFFMWPAPFTWIYGIPLFIVGFFIFFNKNEDEIEQRKDERRSKKK